MSPIIPPAKPWEARYSMISPFTYDTLVPRATSSEEAFDRMIEAYSHEVMGRISQIPVEIAKGMFVNYVAHHEQYYRNVMQALQDHMSFCTSAPPFMKQMNTEQLRRGFRQGHVLHADRRSGKTTALFDAAEEISAQCQCRITIVGRDKNELMAEATRRRLKDARPNQFARLEFVGEGELDRLNGMGSDIMVDEWFRLSERTQDKLKKFRILAAVGTYPHCTAIPI